MLYTVGLHRLSLMQMPKKKGAAKREYYLKRLDFDLIQEVDNCVLHGLGFSRLVKIT